MSFNAGQILAAFRQQGLVVAKDGSASSQYSNVASLAKRIERESNVPPRHDKSLKRKAAAERSVEGKRKVAKVGKPVRVLIEELD